MGTFISTLCGIALIVCGIEILTSNLKATVSPPQPKGYVELPKNPSLENTTTAEMKLPSGLHLVPNSTPITMSSDGAIRVEGLDKYLEGLKVILTEGEYVNVEDTKTKHRYWIRKVK